MGGVLLKEPNKPDLDSDSYNNHQKWKKDTHTQKNNKKKNQTHHKKTTTGGRYDKLMIFCLIRNCSSRRRRPDHSSNSHGDLKVGDINRERTNSGKRGEAKSS